MSVRHRPERCPESLIPSLVIAAANGGRGERDRLVAVHMPAIRAIARDAAKNENRMSSFILGVVNSRAFQMSRADAAETESDSRVLARP